MNFQKDHAPPGMYDGTCTIPKSASYTFTGAHTFQSSCLIHLPYDSLSKTRPVSAQGLLRSQPFIRAHNKALSVAAMCVGNEDCSGR
jgi:hypothetical protein